MGGPDQDDWQRRSETSACDSRKTRARLATAHAGAGAVQMTNLIGDPTKPGLYTVRVVIWVTGYGPSDTRFVQP